MLKKKQLLIVILIFCLAPFLKGQVTIGDAQAIDYTSPKNYFIGGITVSGSNFVDQSIVIMLSGLSVGDQIEVPGLQITNAIKRLWGQGMFEEVSIRVERIQGNVIFLDIYLAEKPKLSRFAIAGLKKAEADKVRDELSLKAGDALTDHALLTSKQKIKRYFIGKGFLHAEVTHEIVPDTMVSNSVILTFHVDKKDRVRIGSLEFIGNEQIHDRRLHWMMKETRAKGTLRFWKRSRFREQDFEADQKSLIAAYNKKGFRDASIERDSIYFKPDGNIALRLYINEGPKYFFRNITWVGNTKYTDRELSTILGIQPGDIYNQELLDRRLFMNPQGMDVSSLYLDDGYLFFNIMPVELRIENDSIDLEMRISEGKQAVLSDVTVVGNTRTNDHVILREIRTRPGQLFSRSDIIRTQQELAQSKYFDNEKLGLDYDPNPQDGTVALVYQVEEASSDQIELSGGWGGGYIIGTLGVSFNNFSINNIFKKGAWRPLPSGDGQKLAIRGSSYGLGFYNLSLSFTEPWLGGKKPNSFSVSAYHSAFSNTLPKEDPRRYSFKINGASLSLGKRLQWPDDFFTLSQNVSFQNYTLENYTLIDAFNNGRAHNYSYGIYLTRNSTDDWIYPTKGSELEITTQFTAPYSLLNGKDYNTLSSEEKYKWVEYHKWRVKSSYFINLAGNLVLHTRTRMGFLGSYNRDIGVTPFERFYLGGDGLSGINQFDGREIIGMRGYDASQLNPRDPASNVIGGTIFNKHSLELRYAIAKSPMSTIYAMVYFEAGNAWADYLNYNPLDLKRTTGVGVRIFLPMFGMLGLDYAWGLDEIPGVKAANKGMFHFSINNSID
jgi:outer membrane protein insertion porin family